MINLQDESEVMVRQISDLVETFVTNLKRGKLAAKSRGGESLSTAAAVEAVELMANIVRLFQAGEEQPRSTTVQMLRSNFPAKEVANMQVHRLLILIGKTGDALLRSQFGTLLLMNVTRRVLSIVREAAATNKASEAELEEEAKGILNDIASEEEEEDDDDDNDNNDEEVSTGVVPKQRSALLGSEKPLVLDDAPSHRSMQPKNRLSVRFDEASLARSGGGSGGHPHTSSLADFASPLLKRSTSIVATEIPGQQILTRAPSRREASLDAQEAVEFPVKAHHFYQDALDGIEEFEVEIEGMAEELCKRAPRQLHPSDTVITMGCSHTTRRYLREAASAGRTFKIIILEGAPSPPEAVHELAHELRERGLSVQCLPDSSAFAVMSTCTKVLMGAESVLANGGMLAPVGAHVLCVAARHFAVPVLVVTTTLKMSPYYPSDQLCTRLVRIARSGAQEMPWSTYGSPEDVLPLPYGVPVVDGGRGFTVHSPVTEYVPPELITLYATNETEFVPSQIHRIVRANYSDVD